MSRRSRIIALVLGIPAVLIAAAAIAVYVMLQPQRFTSMMRHVASQAGLELSLATPAQPSLWPRPSVLLQGLQVTPKGSDQPLLLATRVRLMVPWRDILGGHTAISQLEVTAPRIDLGALGTLLGRMTPGTSGRPVLPNIDAGVVVRGGSLVRNDTLIANQVSLHTGRLHPGQPFELSGSAQAPDGTSYSLKLATTPKPGGQAVTFDPLHLQVDSTNGARLVLDGQARWLGGAQLRANLHGKGQLDDHQPYTLDLASVPPQQGQPMRLHLQAQGTSIHADLRASPTQLSAWWKNFKSDTSGAPLTAPPVAGSVQADQLDFGKVHIKGLSVQSGPDVPAAAGSAAPAHKATGKQ